MNSRKISYAHGFVDDIYSFKSVRRYDFGARYYHVDFLRDLIEKILMERGIHALAEQRFRISTLFEDLIVSRIMEVEGYVLSPRYSCVSENGEVLVIKAVKLLGSPMLGRGNEEQFTYSIASRFGKKRMRIIAIEEI